jgi:phosphohistidine phosphatase
MLLYLIRHAIAVNRNDPGVLTDESRALTPLGIKKMRINATALAKMDLNLKEIWTSPLIRARQTAEILKEELSTTPRIRAVKELAPGGDHSALIELIGRHLAMEEVALVGHEPDLGILATRLIVGTNVGTIRFKKGGAACIELEEVKPPARGDLHWLLTPKQLAWIA